MKPTTSKEKFDIAQFHFGTNGDFNAYFRQYDDFATGGDFLVQVERIPRTKLSHQHVLAAAKYLENNPEMTLDELKNMLHLIGLSDDDACHAIELAIRSKIMVDSDAKKRHGSGNIIGGYKPMSWLQHDTFLSFVEKLFPHICGNPSENAKLALEEHEMLRAWKLQNRYGIRFRMTNNLAQHLLYDSRRSFLYLFHHTSFLKAHLCKVKKNTLPLECGLRDSLAMGTLPPQLLVETLHSLQEILFRPDDTRSMKILNRLIAKNEGFDKDCAQVDGYKLFNQPPDEFGYVYWGERIAALNNLSTAKPPRNKLEKWLKRQSTEGNALFIALLALLISIAVGLVSVGLAAVQVWIAWMAWKYPETQ